MADRFEELDRPENAQRLENWQKIGLDAIEADLKYRAGVGYVGKYRNLAWLWVERERLREREKAQLAANADKMKDKSFDSVVKKTFKDTVAKIVVYSFLAGMLFCAAIYLGALFGIEWFEAIYSFLKAQLKLK